jgi:outer membrane protein assembly factor BamA
MKVTVMARSSAKRNMNINTCHIALNFCKLAGLKMAKIREYKGFILLMLCCLCMRVGAQKEYTLRVQLVDSAETSLNELSLQTSFASKSNCISYVRELPKLLMIKGYISASIDSVGEDSSSAFALLFAGKKYKWDSLHVDEKDWVLLNNLGYNKSSFNDKPFDQQKVNNIYKQLLDYFSNNGYPFAKIFLDSISMSNSAISATLKIVEGQLYHIDTIILNGNVRISKNFITHYIGIDEKSVYQQSKLDKINSRFAELSFLQQSQPYSLAMLNTGAELNFFLQNKASNQINALIGFLPANTQTGGKLLVTGEAQLNLRNPFGNGEVLAVNWEQLQKKSPRLDLLFQRPYLFHSPLGVNLNFQLYKRDSLFLNIHSQAGIQYNISTKQAFSVFVQLNKSDLLNVDTTLIRFTKKLPDVIDYTETSLAFAYNFNNTNYRFNPRSGNELQFTTSFGRKYVHENNTILAIRDNSFDYKTLYDTVRLKSYTFRSTLNAAHYFPIGKQAAIKTALNAGWFHSPNYFQNELFQIGGFRLLRGFDEESIYTNLYSVGTFEYRYLLGQNSWYFVFADAGYAAYKSTTTSFHHTYTGVGTGIAFETKTGIFNISYAVGKRNDVHWDLRQSKIHIGFVSVF